jgi:hypothetical protein
METSLLMSGRVNVSVAGSYDQFPMQAKYRRNWVVLQIMVTKSVPEPQWNNIFGRNYITPSPFLGGNFLKDHDEPQNRDVRISNLM